MSIKDIDSCKLTNQNKIPDEIDDLTLSQACETTENENYAFENLGILSLNNEAENATLNRLFRLPETKRRVYFQRLVFGCTGFDHMTLTP
jgi:hypothetical protein